MANNHHTTCAQCGKEIHQHGRGRKRKFCSKQCNSVHQYRRKVRPHRKNKRPAYTHCLTCGVKVKERLTGRKVKYCSDKCRRKAGYKYEKKQTVMTCKECGTLFLRMLGGSAKWCSEGCKPLRHRTWWKMSRTICTCEACGKPYVPKKSHEQNKYCSNECSYQAREPVCTCIVCGDEFKKKSNSRGKYCGLSCYHKDRSRVLREKNIRKALKSNPYSAIEWRGCHVCGEELGPRPGQAKFCQKCKDALGNAANPKYSAEFLRDRINGRKCSVCGEAFIPHHNKNTVCSAKCNRQTEEYKKARAEYRKTPQYKKKKRIENRIRRARKYHSGPYDKIDPVDIFERDGWCCMICGAKTPKSLRGSYDESAPELDHIVPLSIGGTHTVDNVQCSCRSCNGKKGMMHPEEYKPELNQ